MKIIAAIEAGGTKINCGIAKENGEIIEKIRIDTTDPKTTIEKIIEYFKNKSFDVIGLASFGPIDPVLNSKTYGYITNTPKKGWANTDFVGALKKHFNKPIAFDTDVNAAVLAEKMWGHGLNLDNILYLTIGTGIGGGAIVNGKILHGLTHPEMGHILIKKEDNFPGNCPFHKDCFEGLCSGPAIEKRSGTKSFNIPKDDKIWDVIASDIATALVNYIFILCPEKIIIGGGVMMQEHLFGKIRKKVIEKLNGYLINDNIVKNIDEYIVYPKLGEFAGFYGAIALGVNIK